MQAPESWNYLAECDVSHQNIDMDHWSWNNLWKIWGASGKYKGSSLVLWEGLVGDLPRMLPNDQMRSLFGGPKEQYDHFKMQVTEMLVVMKREAATANSGMVVVSEAVQDVAKAARSRKKVTSTARLPPQQQESFYVPPGLG